MADYRRKVKKNLAAERALGVGGDLTKVHTCNL